MSFPTSTRNPTSDSSPRGRAFLITLAVLAVAAVLFLTFVGVYTDFLWYDSVDFAKVFSAILSTRLLLFAAFGLVVGLAVWSAMVAVYRTRPDFDPRLSASLEGYRRSIEPVRRSFAIGIATFLGVLAGLSATNEWGQWMLFRNGGEFGTVDAQYGLDVGFYVFTLPFLRYLIGFGFMVLFLSLILLVIGQYLYGGLRLQSGVTATEAAQVQVSLLLGLICLLKAVAYWLDRYSLIGRSDDFVEGFTGLKYRDVQALVPARSILAGIALVCALLFFINIFRRTWTLPLVGLGLLGVSALVIGGLYPALVQQFQVRPNEPGREAPYISRNIEATLQAYDLADAQKTDYPAQEEPNPAALTADRGTLENIRLMDPAILSPTFRALQQIRTFYSFPDTLDVDRYELPNGRRGAIVSTREVDLAAVPQAQRNWANDHLVYTHGYGLVAAFDNEARPDGEPVFFEKDIPPIGDLEIDQPRIYFGEKSPVYSIVGATGDPRELDYPDDTSPTGQRNNTYDGAGGVNVGSPLNRLSYAVKFSEPNILLSSLIGPESKILYTRDPISRVKSIAPWLRLDSDPYPAVAGGRIVWMVDGYTTTDHFPYATRLPWADATSDSLTVRRQVNLQNDDINYVRNSVKAVVDAYDGSVSLYAWDPSDPVLQAWMKAFPDVVKPASEMPADMQAHVRYPEDIFKAQRLVYSRYHVTDPTSFYNGQDFWYVPTDPTQEAAGRPQPPYYLTLRMPDQATQEFALTTTFSPARRQTLAAFMAASAEPGPGYGTLRVLQLPRNSVIPGPQQVQNSFESDPEVATQLSLLRRGGSEVDLGNLLSLPVADGFLYVEPVYVRASTEGYPLLRKVLVAFGQQVAFEDTLADALAKVLGETAAQSAADKNSAKNNKQDGQPKSDAQQDLDKALQEAEQALSAAEKALAAGDFTAYGKAQEDLAQAIQDARDAQKRLVAKGAAGQQSPAPGESVAPEPSVSPEPAASESAAAAGGDEVVSPAGFAVE